MTDIPCLRARDDLNNLDIVALSPENRNLLIRPPLRLIYKWLGIVPGINSIAESSIIV